MPVFGPYVSLLLLTFSRTSAAKAVIGIKENVAYKVDVNEHGVVEDESARKVVAPHSNTQGTQEVVVDSMGDMIPSDRQASKVARREKPRAVDTLTGGAFVQEAARDQSQELPAGVQPVVQTPLATGAGGVAATGAGGVAATGAGGVVATGAGGVAATGAGGVAAPATAATVAGATPSAAASAPTPAPKKSHTMMIGIVVVLLLVAGAGGYYYMTTQQAPSSTVSSQRLQQAVSADPAMQQAASRVGERQNLKKSDLMKKNTKADTSSDSEKAAPPKGSRAAPSPQGGDDAPAAPPTTSSRSARYANRMDKKEEGGQAQGLSPPAEAPAQPTTRYGSRRQMAADAQKA